MKSIAIDSKSEAKVFGKATAVPLRTRSIGNNLLRVFAIVALLCSRPGMAQVDQGAIIGVVTDSSGAVIPGAEVTVAETDTGLVLKAKTNSGGRYTNIGANVVALTGTMSNQSNTIDAHSLQFGGKFVF